MIYELVFSATGRTQKALDIISDVWKEEKTVLDLSLRELTGTYAFTKEDLCLLAVPVYGGRIPTPATANLKKLQGNGAKVALIAVFGNRAVDDCLLEMRDLMTAQGFQPVAAIEASVQHSIFPSVAQERPDADDKAELEAFAKKIQETLANGNYNAQLNVPGNFPYVELKPASFHPQASDACVKCGICAEKCPTGAISLEDPSQTDNAKCIACMRCAELCPVHARDLSPEFVSAVTEKMWPLFQDRKPNKLHL